MSVQHVELAAGRWAQMSFMEQMANVGSEVGRALNWRAKNNADYSQRSFDRALELLDLTLGCATSFPRLKEVARTREALVDFFDTNSFGSSEAVLKKYFLHFAYAVRKDR